MKEAARAAGFDDADVEVRATNPILIDAITLDGWRPVAVVEILDGHTKSTAVGSLLYKARNGMNDRWTRHGPPEFPTVVLEQQLPAAQVSAAAAALRYDATAGGKSAARFVQSSGGLSCARGRSESPPRGPSRSDPPSRSPHPPGSVGPLGSLLAQFSGQQNQNQQHFFSHSGTRNREK